MEALCGGLPFEPGLEGLASSSSSSSFVGESVGAGVLTKHPPLEPGPVGLASSSSFVVESVGAGVLTKHPPL